MSDKRITVSLKGSSQNHAWVVLNTDTVDELVDLLGDLGVEVTQDASVLQAVAEANALYQGVANVTNPSGRAPAPTPGGSGEPAQEAQAEAAAPARQRGNGGTSSYGRKKAAAGSGGRGGRKPKLTYEEASADCPHGERRRYTKPDVDWVLYGCPLDKNDPNNCGANFIDKSEDAEG